MRIAMLLHKTIEHDSRVRREARALSAGGHAVTVLHLPRRRGDLDGDHDGFEVRSATPPAWVRHRLPTLLYRLVFMVAFVRGLRRLRPDAVHAHDVAMLAPGWLGARLTGARLVYDSHEYAVGVPYRERSWALFVAALERLLIGRCAVVITVSDGIAARLEERYGLRRRPVVVRNLPDPAEDDPDAATTDLRRDLGLADGTPLVLHLGAVGVDRGCETLVAAMEDLGGVHLLFLGADDSAYAAGLRALAERGGAVDRIHFRPSVPVGSIRAHSRQADVGVSLLEDTCENHRQALPNKVFEYLGAGLPVVVSDLPELRRLVQGRDDGWAVSPSQPAAVAVALRAALEADSGARAAAEPPPDWAVDAERLLRAYPPARADDPS
jgi:glycosyltransferase involved in cell wall biosynthesis